MQTYFCIHAGQFGQGCYCLTASVTVEPLLRRNQYIKKSSDLKQYSDFKWLVEFFVSNDYYELFQIGSTCDTSKPCLKQR